MSTISLIVQRCLEELTEKALQERFIEPLLRASGFESVRDVSGPNEKGMDLIASKREFGISFLYAVQIKKLKVSGRVASPTSLSALLYQLKQAVSERVYDPATRSERIPQRLVFVTPYTINRAALESAINEFQEISSKQVIIIDGPLLADQIVALLPELAASLQDDIGYRIQCGADYDKISESIAFGLRHPLRMADIFVETDYACFDLVEQLLQKIPVPKIDRSEVKTALRDEELRALFELTLYWTRNGQPLKPVAAAVGAAMGKAVIGNDGRLDREGLRTLILGGDPKGAEESRKKLDSILLPFMPTDLSGFLKELSDHSVDLIERTGQIADSQTTDSAIHTLCLDIAVFQASVLEALRMPIFETPLAALLDEHQLLESFPGRKEILQPTIISEYPVDHSPGRPHYLAGQQNDRMQKAPKFHLH